MGLLGLLAQVPGPTFLLFFAGFSIACIAIGWWLVNADSFASNPLPEPAHFDPVAIAALRGGWRAVVETALFDLWKKKLIDIKEGISQDFYLGTNIETQIFEVQSAQKNNKTLTPIEKEIYQFLQSSKKTEDLFHDIDLKIKIEGYLAPVYSELKQLGLIRTEEDMTRAMWIATITAIIMAIVGGAKLYLGITRGRPVIFLILLLGASIFALFTTIKPTATLTRRGRRYLGTIEKQFDMAKAFDPTSALAILGIGVLSTYTPYTPFYDAFAGAAGRKKEDQKNGGSSYSGGCGGGSSDGGGGGCGGCGGCGS